MADRYTSRVALVLDARIDDVGALVNAARAAKDLDRGAPVRGDGTQAQEVHWGGRMDRGVVRQVVSDDDGEPLLRTEAYIGGDGLTAGMQRQARLLQGLARQLGDRVRSVRDLSAMAEHDVAWMNRLSIGMVELEDAIRVAADGEGIWWARTWGAARFDVPDLELYGLQRAHVPAAERLLRSVHEQLLHRGLKTQLTLADGRAIYLVPVLEAWQRIPLDWPGVGKAGQDRGAGLDGPRATLSLLHPPRFGRYKLDFEAVIASLTAG